ncbi:MAG: aldolase catalytic domain-containing protein [Firmicutes bacterium]|nr:aldolase catalytic domain-containing protein [Bacillota bacterium]
MGKKGTLMSVRKDVKVIDCTIRDGGLVNNFYFEDEFIKDLYIANIAAGVDYMEFGYKADYDLFDKDSYGKWKFCDEADIRAIVGDNLSDLKISVMADVGRTNLKRDILPRSESVIDMIRVATYINTIPAALEMVEYCHELGYETTINIMAISNANESDMRQALELIAESNVDAVYLVDSYGSIYPEKMRELADLYLEYMEPAGKLVGIHAHNNQQLAFANTIEALSQGVSYLDATVSSMGRGAGNCPMELLISFLQNPKYKIIHILRFIEKHIPRLLEQGAVWGYDIQYLLTGRFNLHPSSAIEFTKSKRKDYSKFYSELLDKE